MLVYKRVTALAGHTSRVAELLEAVARMSAPNASSYHREVTPLAPCHCHYDGSLCLMCTPMPRSISCVACCSVRLLLRNSTGWGVQLSATLRHHQRMAGLRHIRLAP